MVCLTKRKKNGIFAYTRHYLPNYMVCAYYYMAYAYNYTIAIRYALSICAIRHTAYETHVVQSRNYGCGYLIA